VFLYGRVSIRVLDKDNLLRKQKNTYIEAGILAAKPLLTAMAMERLFGPLVLGYCMKS